MDDVIEFGDKSSCVAYFIFRKSNNESNKKSIEYSASIFKMLNQNDRNIYYCLCSNKDQFKNKLHSWCSTIGKLVNEEVLLSGNELLGNDISTGGNLLDCIVENLPEKTLQQTTAFASVISKKQENELLNRNSFLCIYAHMGENGLSNGWEETDSNDMKLGGTISWEELFVIIKDYVSTLWLAGCCSIAFVKKYVSQFRGGKLQSLLATTHNSCWLELIKHFKNAYCMDPITFTDEILLEIYKEKPELAVYCKLYVKNENDEFEEQSLLKFKE